MLNGFKMTMLLFLVATSSALGQCVAPDFTIPPTACLNQRIPLQADNTYSSYEWDLCAGELAGTPTATVLSNNFGGYALNMELVDQGGDYYGFFLSRGSNKLYRLDFGTDVTAPPLLRDLGGLGISSGSWRMIEIVKDGDNFLGFIVDENAIYRVSFGTSLENAPTLETFYSAGLMNFAINGVAVQEGNDKYLFVANGADDKIVRFKFNSSYAEPATSTTIDSFSATGTVHNSGMSFIEDCGTWYALVSSALTYSAFKITFTSGLSDPAPIVSSRYPVEQAAGVSLVKENNIYYGFVQSLNSASSLVRLTFGSDLSGDPVSTDELKNFGYSPNAGMWGLAMYKVKSDWLVVSAEFTGANMYRVKFPQSCFSSTTWTTEASPTTVTANAGSFNVSLEVMNGSGVHSSIAHPITVTSSASPDIDFTSNNVCAAHDVSFNSQNSSNDITLYDWDFKDTGTSASSAPTHQFAAGTYDVSLTVSASSTGCSNTVSRSLKIYSQPVADFTTPSGLVCTNNAFTFNNLVTDNYDGLATYQWLVDGTQKSTQRDFSYSFPDVGDKTVKLIATIPGCSDENSKSITGLLPGPTGAFTITGQCQNHNIGFNNQSSGPIASYLWDFGDGSASTDVSASKTYGTIGNYNVVMKVTGTNTCVTTISKALTIYSTPQTSFSLDLPPFSCSGSPSQFHDLTPSMTDSNIQSWNWTFGDTGSGTGKNPLHTYTNAGPYTVRLSVTTDRGCSNFVDQQVNITQAPDAMFNYDIACANKATHFTDASNGGVVSWQWKVGSVLYNTQNPTHTFPTSGNYNVQLVATGQNSCTASITRQVTVPVVPVVDFQVANPCSGQPAVFSDLTTNPADGIVQHNWTFNGIGTAAGQQASHTFGNGGTYPVQLALQSLSGCSYSITKQVTVRTSPVASFTMSDQSGPPPLHVVLTNTSTGASTYVWSLGDGSSPSAAVSLEHTFASLGDYNVSLLATSPEGCSRTETKVVSVITPVNELALQNFLLKEAGNSYQGYVQVKNNGNYRVTSFVVNYEIGGGIVLSETVPADLSTGEIKTYTLATAFNQPVSTAFVCAELNSDTDEENNKACATLGNEPTIFNVNPNPADSYLTIESIHPVKEDVHIRLYDMQGGLAYDKSFSVQPGLSRISLDVQNLSPGIYLAVTTSGGLSTSQKLLIVR
jgi:PKD repeat protein